MTVPTDSLQTQLDTITQNTRALVQPERLAITDDQVGELFASGLAERILPVGAEAPDFQLHDALTGKLVRSEDLLALGPIIIKFFRGRWCPYDMTELEMWQDLQPTLRAKHAIFVAISPQLPRQNDFTVQRHNLSFPVLSDPGAAVASSFGLVHTLSEPMQRHYRSILVNIPFINGDQTWQLPLPATFVIAQDKRVRFAEAYADHRVRPEPEAVLAAL